MSGDNKSKPEPHWEHGYRCHGFWLTARARIGWVSLPSLPRRLPRRVYYWGFRLPDGKDLEGECLTLRTAKRKVERLYAEQREKCGDEYERLMSLLF